MFLGPVYFEDACQDGAHASRGVVWMYNMSEKIYAESSLKTTSPNSRTRETI